ncbi:hypothetical protein ACL02R_12195 [Streptomyces sp. MS19]|uniref:hypothetical protein n=1 Tax=Streptomyces sp. MS19 TaxID=3385972 RepID=UPI00399F149F
MKCSSSATVTEYRRSWTGKGRRSEGGGQPGDPAKAAAAILAALRAADTPLRLPLGVDAVDAVRGHLGQVGAELDTWEATARATAFDA